MKLLMKIYFKELVQRFPEFSIRNDYHDIFYTGFSHDSRTVEMGDLYIPIEGEKYDGHAFIAEAIEAGASGALCEKGKYDDEWDVLSAPVILVDSIQEGLQKILNYSISHITAPVVAITGSTGKTVTKEMLIRILQCNKSVLSGEKSNTVWGNASILGKYDGEEVVVLECGMDMPGEIAWHVNSVDPDLGILLNIGHVHAEELGGIEEIYEEKKNLADYMERTGKPLVINIDDEWLDKIFSSYRSDAEIITFGKRDDSDYRISDISVTKDGTDFLLNYYDNHYSVHLNVYGEGQVYNATAAIVAANRLGIGIEACISEIGKYKGSNGRFEILNYGQNLTIVNDAYNANPTSMEMSLNTFNILYPTSEYHRIVFLGDMKELGDVSIEKHKALGEQVSNHSFDEVYFIGEMFEHFGIGKQVGSADEVAALLNVHMADLKGKKVAILLKASNRIGLYQVPDFLKKLGLI